MREGTHFYAKKFNAHLRPNKPVCGWCSVFSSYPDIVIFQVSEMKAEYFPPKEDVILQNEAPTDLYILVTGTVVRSNLSLSTENNGTLPKELSNLVFIVK